MNDRDIYNKTQKCKYFYSVESNHNKYYYLKRFIISSIKAAAGCIDTGSNQ